MGCGFPKNIHQLQASRSAGSTDETFWQYTAFSQWMRCLVLIAFIPAMAAAMCASECQARSDCWQYRRATSRAGCRRRSRRRGWSGTPSRSASRAALTVLKQMATGAAGGCEGEHAAPSRAYAVGEQRPGDRRARGSAPSRWMRSAALAARRGRSSPACSSRSERPRARHGLGATCSSDPLGLQRSSEQPR